MLTKGVKLIHASQNVGGSPFRTFINCYSSNWFDQLVSMTTVAVGNDCNIQKRILHAGKGDLPSYLDGTKVLSIVPILFTWLPVLYFPHYRPPCLSTPTP